MARRLHLGIYLEDGGPKLGRGKIARFEEIERLAAGAVSRRLAALERSLARAPGSRSTARRARSSG